MPLFKLFRSKPSESPAPAPPAQPAGRRRPAPSQAAPARAAPAATQAVPQATQVAGIPVQAPPTVPQVTVQHVQQQLGSVREDLIQPIREVLDNAFSEDMSNILDMLINEASTGMAQLQQQVEVCIMEERFDVLEEISTLASQFQELQQAAERWKAGEASSAGISLSQMTAEQQEEAQEAWLREEEERRRQDEARFREQEEAQQKWLEEQAAAQREEAARQEEQARLVREEAERERQRVQEEQEQLAREEAEQQMREEEEARIAELEEIRRQAAEEERHRGSASDAQDSFAADFDLQVIEVSDVDEVPKECDSRTDGPKIDLPGPTVEVLESWSEEASSSSDFEASPEKDHAKAEGCRRATSVSGVLSYSVAEPEAELANAPSQEVPQPEVPQERQKQVEPPVADESPKPLKQPVGPSGQDQERKSKEVPTPSQAPVHQPTVAGNSSNAVPTVERIDTSASESNVDLAQPSNACQKAKVSVGTVVQEEQVRSAEAALRCTELASQSESKHDGGMMPVPVGAASYSAAHEAEAVLLANRSEAEVFEEAVQSDLETRPGAATPAETRSDGRAPAFPEELVKSTVDEAAQCKLASQAEASVGGDSHSAAVDADEALLAHRSVQEVLPAPHLEPLERPVEPVAPKQLREEAPVRPEQPVEPVTPGGTAPSQASIDPEQQVVEPSSAVVKRIDSATEPNLDLGHNVSDAVSQACRDAVSVVASAGDAPEELPPSACTSSPKLDCTQEALADSSKKAHIFPAPQVEAIPVTGEVSTIRDHTATPTTKDDAFDESRAVQLHDHAVKVAEVSSKSRSSASSFGGKEFEIKTSKANLRANQDRVPAGHVSAELMEELGQIVNRPRFSILKKAKTEGDLETRPKLCLRFSAEVDIREVPLLSPASSPSSPVNSKQFQAVSPNSKSPGSHASDTLTLPLSRTMARETRRGSRGCELPPSSPVAATRSEAEPCVGPFTVEKRSQGFKQEVESQNAVRFEEGSASNAAGFLVWKELDSCAFEPQVQQSSCAAAEHKEPVSPAREQGNQNSIATFARYLYQIARPNHESTSGKVETVQHPADKADNHQNQPIDLPVQHVQQLQTTLNCPEELVRYHRHHKHGKHHKHHSSRPHDSHRSSHSRRRSWKVEGEATAIPAPGSGAMPKKGGSWENLPSSNEKHGYHYYGTCEVTDEMVITAQRGGLTPDLENRVLERAYFLFINGVSDDQCSNYFEALRVELGLMMSSNQMV